MERTDIVELIKQTIVDYMMDDSVPSHFDESTELFGSHGLFDSLGLVTIVLDIESIINEKLNLEIVIADDRAMSQSRSPFRTIGALADYVLLLIQEENERHQSG